MARLTSQQVFMVIMAFVFRGQREINIRLLVAWAMFK